MRNLYLRLGVDPKSSDQEVRAGIERCSNQSIRRDAAAVLLHPNRRRTFDQLHSALTDIGRLRAALGATHTENWTGEVARDYTPSGGVQTSKLDELRGKASRSYTAHVPAQSRAPPPLAWVASGLFILGATAWVASTMPTSDTKSETLTPAFSEPAFKLPVSGTTRRHTVAEGVAPLEIKTSGESNYLVKVVDPATRRDILDIFVRGGEVVEVEVPLGTFLIKYAAGKTWYGYDYRFGPNTAYSKADTTFHFRREGDRIAGYTITLYTVARGNLRTSRIPAAEF